MSRPPLSKLMPLPDDGDARRGRIAPIEFYQARREVPVCRPPDGMDHRIAMRQRIAARHHDRRAKGLGDRFRRRFQFGRPHVSGGRIHQIPHQRDRPRQIDGRRNPRDIAGQQLAYPHRTVLAAVTVEPMLPQHPSQHRRTGQPFGQAIAPFGQRLGEARQAPGAKRCLVRHPRDDHPVAVPLTRQDRRLLRLGPKFLRRQQRATLFRAGRQPSVQRLGLDQMDRMGGCPVSALMQSAKSVMAGM